jgi:hypothetical protein
MLQQKPNPGEMYGIIAAQRRASGNVWLVMSSLAEPAIYIASTLLKRITVEFFCAAGVRATMIGDVFARLTISLSVENPGYSTNT